MKKILEGLVGLKVISYETGGASDDCYSFRMKLEAEDTTKENCEDMLEIRFIHYMLPIFKPLKWIHLQLI